MTTLSFRSYDKKRLKLIARLCRPGESLDLGYAQTPNPYLSAQKTTGVDLSPNMQSVRYANELIGDVRALDRILGGSKYENIIAGEIIEHLEEPYAFLRSLRPFLRPSGRLIISTPNPIAWPTILMEWSMAKKYFFTDEHKYYIAPRWMIRLLEHSGFTVKLVKGVGLWAPILVPPCPAMFSYQVVYVAEKDTDR